MFCQSRSIQLWRDALFLINPNIFVISQRIFYTDWQSPKLCLFCVCPSFSLSVLYTDERCLAWIVYVWVNSFNRILRFDLYILPPIQYIPVPHHQTHCHSENKIQEMFQNISYQTCLDLFLAISLISLSFSTSRLLVMLSPLISLCSLFCMSGALFRARRRTRASSSRRWPASSGVSSFWTRSRPRLLENPNCGEFLEILNPDIQAKLKNKISRRKVIFIIVS